jgi:hypothetical protein
MKKIVRAVGTFVNNLRRYSAPSVALYDAMRAVCSAGNGPYSRGPTW